MVCRRIPCLLFDHLLPLICLPVLRTCAHQSATINNEKHDNLLIINSGKERKPRIRLAHLVSTFVVNITQEYLDNFKQLLLK